MNLKIKRLTDTAIMPTKAHLTDAGLDIYADEDIFIRGGQTVAVSTGLAMAIEPGYYGKLKCRSGLSLKTPLRVIEGTIDADYRGEVRVICGVLSQMFGSWTELVGNETTGFKEIGYSGLNKNMNYRIKRGDKIAQLIIQPLPPVDMVEVTELDDTDRGDGGFGSTGR